MTPTLRLPLLAAAVAVAGCLTVNVYFPEAAIRDLSQQIEEEIRREAGVAAPETTGAALPAAGLVRQAAAALAAAVFTTPAYAQDAVADPGISNPAIRKLIESRSARLAELNGYKSRGVLGEGNDALLVVRDLDAVSDLKERAAVQRLVKAENADREKLFREIAAAQGVDLSQLPRIQSTYAETIRSIARPGDWIQLPGGEWKQK